MRLIPLAIAVTFALAPPLLPHAGAGQTMDDFTLADFRGKEVSLSDVDEPVVVVAFLGVECPLVKLYSARLAEMSKEFQSQGVAFIGINSNQQDSLLEMAHFARTHKVRFPLLKDPGNKVADQFGAQRTPEVFVLDADRQIRYRGRIDDQYTYGLQRPKVKRDYLRDAIESLVQNKPVAVEQTETVGCHIGRILKPQPNSSVTFSNQISRIFNRRCVECHREGEIAPFALTQYDEAVGWAEMIAEVVRERRMPPWHADPKHGEFSNDARLSDQEKQLIYDWVDAGAPEGDPANLPEPPTFAKGWRIGKPDLVVDMADKPFQVPAEGEVKYQYFVVDPGFKEDKWVRAAECRPGNRAVVHHIIVATRRADGGKVKTHGGLSSDWLAATAPGARPLDLPEGMAKFVPAGSKFVFQLHYTPNGTPQEDLSSIGLIFADPEKVRQEVATKKAANTRFRIPPGSPNYEVKAQFALKHNSLLLALFPHMHLRGKAFRYTALFPDGRKQTLLNVPNYDFNWQNSYVLSEPILMPKGTVIECVAHFDNSADNLVNPDPTATVRWGDQTWEEMMIGYFDVALADEDLTSDEPSGARTRKFLSRSEKDGLEISERLKTMAKSAFKSEENLEAFAVAARHLVPQLDRVCLTTVSEGRLRVEMAAQEATLRSMIGGRGISVRDNGTALAECARSSQPTVYRDLSAEKGGDLKFMSRGVSSSVHVPITHQNAPATINFWSQEKDAFPDRAVKLLQDLTRTLR